MSEQKLPFNHDPDQPRLAAWLRWGYARLARLYPPGFRTELAEEMEVTFADLIAAAAKDDRLRLGVLFLREIRDLPGGLLREYWVVLEDRLARMARETGGQEMITNRNQYTVAPTPWRETIFGSLYFFLTGLVFIILMIRPRGLPNRADVLGQLIFWCAYLIPLVGFMVGWIKGMPRWCYPYLSSAIFMTTIFMDEEMVLDRAWGWLTWIPFLLAGAIAYRVTRSFEAFRNIPSQFRQDRGLFTYVMFGLFPFLSFVWFDSNNELDRVYFLITLTVVLTGMAIVYLHSARLGPRVAALLVGFLVSAFVPSIAAHVTWDGFSGRSVMLGVMEASFAALIFFSPLIFLQFERWETRRQAA